MAERFGGQYSPQGSPAQTTVPKSAPGPVPPVPPRLGPEGTKPSAGFKARVLFVLPFFFVWPIFGGDPGRLILNIAAAALLLLAAWLTHEGVLAHMAFDARKVARRPAFPRKIAGAVLTGAALGLGTFAWSGGLIYPLAFALIGAGLHMGAFGPDPLTDKGTEGIDMFQTDRVAKVVAEGEAYIAAMKDAILRAGDRGLQTRVDRFAGQARALFRAVESDPGDLTAARKYLSVYLMGARDATVAFADLYRQNHDAKARADYESLLTDLETTFADKSKAFLANNTTDLDVEIAVLRDRLKLET